MHKHNRYEHEHNHNDLGYQIINHKKQPGTEATAAETLSLALYLSAPSLVSAKLRDHPAGGQRASRLVGLDGLR